MTPLAARLHTLAHAVRCLVGNHAYVVEVPQNAAGIRSTAVHQRCLYCRKQTKGITQDQPRYKCREGLEKPKGLMLHNGRLKRCPCADCDERRKARRQKVTAMRKSA
jgi:hypothetical protein